MGNGEGAKDGNPMAMITFVFMLYLMFTWWTTASSVNPANNGTFINNVKPFITNSAWVYILVLPLAAFMFVTYWIRKDRQEEEGIITIKESYFERREVEEE